MIGERRYLAAFDGPRLVAAARYHVMRQCWHGRWQAMAGVASVMVAPEDRGRGTGRALMSALLELIASRGYQISVLYPATSAIYRSLGWEIAGVRDQLRFPARSLRSLTGPDGNCPRRRDGAASAIRRLRRCGPDDAAAVLAALTDAHQELRDSGPATRDQETVRRWLATGTGTAIWRRTGSSSTAGATATTRSWWIGWWPRPPRPPGRCGARRVALVDRRHRTGLRRPGRPGELADPGARRAAGEPAPVDAPGGGRARGGRRARLPARRRSDRGDGPGRPGPAGQPGPLDAAGQRGQGRAHPRRARRGRCAAHRSGRAGSPRCTRVPRWPRCAGPGWPAAGPRPPTPRWTPRLPPLTCSTTSEQC